MEYTYAVLILNETDEELNETNITRVLDAANVDVEESRVKALVAALEDVTIADVLPAPDIDAPDTAGESPSDERDERDETKETDDGNENDAGDSAATESDAALVEGGGAQTETGTEATQSETGGGG